jgi:hypothetical protein
MSDPYKHFRPDYIFSPEYNKELWHNLHKLMGGNETGNPTQTKEKKSARSVGAARDSNEVSPPVSPGNGDPFQEK